ncbi:unnamed protein product [Arabidopsis lyrata]|uniref:Predicted protein n=1 Tax=Arabidopsis lyrata subsp. lyrata TaxID=81972 RepID=D7KW51_ARALL|nr:predicted protein [Arabidopsis lyrata subsp. lyrata]CAH8256290.1 unnamed protein product [Arabidopsis lyrata]
MASSPRASEAESDVDNKQEEEKYPLHIINLIQFIKLIELLQKGETANGEVIDDDEVRMNKRLEVMLAEAKHAYTTSRNESGDQIGSNKT